MMGRKYRVGYGRTYGRDRQNIYPLHLCAAKGLLLRNAGKQEAQGQGSSGAALHAATLVVRVIPHFQRLQGVRKIDMWLEDMFEMVWGKDNGR